MASEIRVNSISNRSGLGTITFSSYGVEIAGITTIEQLSVSSGTDANFSGVVTATAFYGDASNLTNVGAAASLGDLNDVVTDNIGVGTDQILSWNNDLNRWERGYSNALPIMGGVSVTESSSNDENRFANQDFTVTVSMNDDGYPASTKSVKLSVSDSSSIVSRPVSNEITAVDTSYSYTDEWTLTQMGAGNHRRVFWEPSRDFFWAYADSSYGTNGINYSYDGINWNAVNTNSVGAIYGAAYNPNTGEFLVNEWQRVKKTKDFVNWTQIATLNNNGRNEVYSGIEWFPALNRYFTIQGGYLNGGSIARSYDGVNWSYQSGTSSQTLQRLVYSEETNTMVCLAAGNHSGYAQASYSTNPDAATPSWTNTWVASGVDMVLNCVYAAGGFNNWYWWAYNNTIRKGAPTSGANGASYTTVKTWTNSDISPGTGDIMYISELDILLLAGWDNTSVGRAWYCTPSDDTSWTEIQVQPVDDTARYGWSDIAYSPKLGRYVMVASAVTNSNSGITVAYSDTVGISTTRTKLTFSDSTGLSGFRHSEIITESDGSAVGAMHTTTGNTMVLYNTSGSFNANSGLNVYGEEKNASTLYAKFGSTGIVTSFVDYDPGYTPMTGNGPYTFEFPNTDSNGLDLDTKFGSSSAITVSATATNKLGSVSKTSTALTPASVRTPSSFTWNADTDAYTNTTTTANRIIDVHSRMRRCLVTDNGLVTYLDADDSTKLAGDWLRICENTQLNTARTGTHGSETANTPLRSGVSTWSAGTYRRGARVIHNSSLWECIVDSTTSTPAAGSSASTLDGTAGQVMVEIPLFSVKHTRSASGSYNEHGFYLVRGIKTDDSYEVHPAFVRPDGSYRPYLYIGAYLASGTNGVNCVSGQTNSSNYTRAAARAAAQSRGDGWRLMSIYQYNVLQWLLITEYQNMDSQEVLGNGSSEGSSGTATTGLSNSRGNRCQNAYTGGGSSTDYVSYRGVENIFGRGHQWADGANITSGTSLYVTDNPLHMIDDTTENLTLYGTIGGSDGGYLRDISAGVLFISSSTTGGSSTTYVADALSVSTGTRIMRVGGASGDGAAAGVMRSNYDSDSSNVGANRVSRITYASESL